MATKKIKSPDSKPSGTKDAKQAIKVYLRHQIESAWAGAEMEEFLIRRNIRMALGIGDFSNFKKELENELKNTSKVEIPKPKLTKKSREIT